MEVSFSYPVAMPSIDESGDDRQHIWRNSEKKRRDSPVSQGLDESGKEIGHGGGGDDAEEHDHLKRIRSACKMQVEDEVQTRIHILISKAAIFIPPQKL